MGREVEEETEVRMRRAEREGDSYAELLHCTETNMQVSDTFQYGASVIISTKAHHLDALENWSDFMGNYHASHKGTQTFGTGTA